MSLLPQSNPIVSICIPTYMEQGYLSNTLYHLSHQTAVRNKSCEIIIVDYDPDGKDTTAQTVEEFLSVCPSMNNWVKNILLINVEERGIGHARNVAVANASCPIICNVDADSYYSDDDGIMKMIKPILNDNAVMTVVHNAYYDGDPIVDTSVAVSNLVQYVWPFHLTGCCILKDVIMKAGGFSDENTEDELGKMTSFVRNNGLELRIVNDTNLIKSARRVKALVRDPLNTYYKDFSIAYR